MRFVLHKDIKIRNVRSTVKLIAIKLFIPRIIASNTDMQHSWRYIHCMYIHKWSKKVLSPSPVTYTMWYAVSETLLHCVSLLHIREVNEPLGVIVIHKKCPSRRPGICVRYVITNIVSWVSRTARSLHAIF